MALRFPSMSLLKPITVPDPMERVRTLADARQAAQQEQMRGQQIQSTQRDQQAGAAIQQAFIQSGGELNEDTLRAIAQAAPHLYPQYKQVFDAQQTATTNRELQARKVAQENFEALEGQELPSATVQRATATPMAYPGQVGQGPSMEGRTDTLGATFQPQTIPGAPSLGQPGVQVTPRAAWQKLKETTDAEQRKLENEKRRRRDEIEATREANIYTIINPATNESITAPKDLIDNLLTQQGLDKRHAENLTAAEQRHREDIEQRRLDREARLAAARENRTDKPPSAANLRTFSFYMRAKDSVDTLDSIESDVQKLGLWNQTRMAFAPNFLQTQLGQIYEQAQRQFTEARLRKDSGAAIPEHEYDNDRRTYFVRPGDSNETLERKRAARANLLKSLQNESGRAYTQSFGLSDAAEATHRFNPATGQIEEIKETK